MTSPWEGRRKLLLITPASLRKQWSQELHEKFSLPSVILDAKRVRDLDKAGQECPLEWSEAVVILSYDYAARISEQLRRIGQDLVVFDEAHKLRNVYKGSEASRSSMLAALADRQKLLLNGTPLQNNLMELYGLLSVIDEQFFGAPEAFRAEFGQGADNGTLALPGRRLEPARKHTIRRHVRQAGLINYTRRMSQTFDFTLSALEERLYEGTSDQSYYGSVRRLQSGVLYTRT